MPTLLCIWGMAPCTADLSAGAISHLSGCAPEALPPTTGHSAGLPPAAKQYTRMSASKRSACSALLPVEALQCGSLA